VAVPTISSSTDSDEADELQHHTRFSSRRPERLPRRPAEPERVGYRLRWETIRRTNGHGHAVRVYAGRRAIFLPEAKSREGARLFTHTRDEVSALDARPYERTIACAWASATPTAKNSPGNPSNGDIGRGACRNAPKTLGARCRSRGARRGGAFYGPKNRFVIKDVIRARVAEQVPCRWICSFPVVAA